MDTSPQLQTHSVNELALHYIIMNELT